MKLRYYIIFIIFCFFALPSQVSAMKQESGSTAQLQEYTTEVQKQRDSRTQKLKAYLERHGSDLAEFAPVLVAEADKYGLDWNFVAAIAGLESTYCKHIPSGSYNCWGWGIPTGASSGIAFDGYEHGIQIVSEGLRKRYVDRGLLTIEEIGGTYAASPTWASRVRFIMNSIEEYTLPNDSSVLAFTL